jgi:NAD(P)-dependent dehydrogenase (short-subunit alcohol dehydrogenase family)
MGRVSGKVALVTGGASGIGRACCEVLAREGAKVAVTDIDEAQGREVADTIKRNGGEAAFYRHDVTSEDEWIAVVRQVESDLGPLNILVNNAGIGIAGPIWEFSLADWRKQNAINLDGVFLGTKHGILSMRKAGSGSIIVISSLAGMEGAPFLAGYCATKGGVRLFAKAVALECARSGDNIRVNSVHPGVIDTPIWTKFPEDDQGPYARLRKGNQVDPNEIARRTTPMRRPGKPEEIANGVLFLASDESSFMTGAELVIDGGVHAG